ncbi:MAG: DUF5658 family protein [Gemmataceae bacterium]|nr:DUF5658 family protein [Gemmataceae bacterium]
MFRSNRLWLAGLAVFVALSATDFVQTYALIETGGGAVYESNPVAGRWLEQYGWVGLAAYKAAAVLVVAGAVVVLAGRSRRAATGVAAVACAAVLGVTVYSRDLLANGRHDRPLSDEEVAAEAGLPHPREFTRPIDRRDIERLRARRPVYAGEERLPRSRPAVD